MASEFELQSVLLACMLLLVLPGVRNAVLPQPPEDSQQQDNRPDRIAAVDILRGISIVAVVLIHCSYFMLEAQVWTVWHTYMNNALRFAIPVFLTTSGLLLPAVTPTVSAYVRFLLTRGTALLVPYVLVAALVLVVFGTQTYSWWYDILSGTVEIPFYFVVVLMQLYILYPIIAPLAQRRWFVSAALIISIVASITYPLAIFAGASLFTPYLFYFVWGIYMRPYVLVPHRLTALPVWPWLVLIAVYVGSQLFMPPTVFYNSHYLFGIAVVCLGFRYLYTLPSTPYVLKLCGRIGTMSLWIFLTHFTFMEVVLPYLEPIFTYSIGIGLFVWYVVSIVGSVALGMMCAHGYTQVSRYIQTRS